MFTNNPFAALSDVLPASVMQIYVVLMVLAGASAGTLVRHRAQGQRQSISSTIGADRRARRRKPSSGGEMVSLAVKTGRRGCPRVREFCSARRRIAHLLTMYGFVIYVIATAVHGVRLSDTRDSDTLWPATLWWIGGLMVCVGGYWFWFFIRADVAAEGNSPLRIMRADLFVLSLLASVTLGLDLGLACKRERAARRNVFFGLYIIATTVLFGSVPWSKFAHMFFKPAAAFEKEGLLRERHEEQPARALRQARAVRQRREQPRHLLHRSSLGARTPCQPSFT